MAVIIGSGINYFLTSHNNEDNELNYFKMIDFFETGSVVNYITLATIVIIFLSTVFMSRQTIKKILSKTPGDLIYNR